jgi:hypothetical protein
MSDAVRVKHIMIFFEKFWKYIQIYIKDNFELLVLYFLKLPGF